MAAPTEQPPDADGRDNALAAVRAMIAEPTGSKATGAPRKRDY